MTTREPIWNAVYLGLIQECERAQVAGEIHGNAHHMAQGIVKRAEELLASERTLSKDKVLKAVRQATDEECRQRTTIGITVRITEQAMANVKEELDKNTAFPEPEPKRSFWRNLFRR